MSIRPAECEHGHLSPDCPVCLRERMVHWYRVAEEREIELAAARRDLRRLDELLRLCGVEYSLAEERIYLRGWAVGPDRRRYEG